MGKWWPGGGPPGRPRPPSAPIAGGPARVAARSLPPRRKQPPGPTPARSLPSGEKATQRGRPSAARQVVAADAGVDVPAADRRRAGAQHRQRLPAWSERQGRHAPVADQRPAKQALVRVDQGNLASPADHGDKFAVRGKGYRAGRLEFRGQGVRDQGVTDVQTVDIPAGGPRGQLTAGLRGRTRGPVSGSTASSHPRRGASQVVKCPRAAPSRPRPRRRARARRRNGQGVDRPALASEPAHHTAVLVEDQDGAAVCPGQPRPGRRRGNAARAVTGCLYTRRPPGQPATPPIPRFRRRASPSRSSRAAPLPGRPASHPGAPGICPSALPAPSRGARCQSQTRVQAGCSRPPGGRPAGTSAPPRAPATARRGAFGGWDQPPRPEGGPGDSGCRASVRGDRDIVIPRLGQRQVALRLTRCQLPDLDGMREPG